MHPPTANDKLKRKRDKLSRDVAGAKKITANELAAAATSKRDDRSLLVFTRVSYTYIYTEATF